MRVETGLLSQTYYLELENDNVIQKLNFESPRKSTINLIIPIDTILCMGSKDTHYNGHPVEVKKQNFEQYMNNAYLCAMTYKDYIDIPGFAGCFDLGVDILEGVEFPHFVRYTFEVELLDLPKIAKTYKVSATKKQLRDIVKKDIQDSLTNAVKRIVIEQTRINNNASELLLSKDQIVQKVYASMDKEFYPKGLKLGSMIEFVVEPNDEVQAKIKQIRDKKNANATDVLNKPARDLEKERLDAENQREINVIRAENTKIIEKTENITKTVNGQADSKDEKKVVKKRFCRECGEEIKHATAKFCENCGTKIN